MYSESEYKLLMQWLGMQIDELVSKNVMHSGTSLTRLLFAFRRPG